MKIFNTYIRIRHSVKRTNSERVFVHDEEVSFVLFFNNIAEFLLVFSAQVIVVVLKQNTTVIV